MKNLLWIVVAAIIAGGGYMLYSGSSPKELINDAAEAVNAPAALEAASDAAGAAVEGVEGAVEDAVDAFVNKNVDKSKGGLSNTPGVCFVLCSLLPYLRRYLIDRLQPSRYRSL